MRTASVDREAARLLRPAGDLVFLRFSAVAMLCMPATARSRRPYNVPSGIWAASSGPTIQAWSSIPRSGSWVRILCQSGFTVNDIIEVYAPDDAVDNPHNDNIPARWARQWPSEEIWLARRV